MNAGDAPFGGFSSRDLRDHGYGNHPVPTEPPVASPPKREGLRCPHCRCGQVMQIRVEIKDDKRLVGGEGIGTYLGCPACPWASPMVTVAKGGD